MVMIAQTGAGFRMSDFGFRLAGMALLLETLWLGECVVRRGRPDLKGGCRISDFGFRLAGMRVVGGDTLAGRICGASRAAGPYGWNPSDFSPWVFRPPIV